MTTRGSILMLAAVGLLVAIEFKWPGVVLGGVGVVAGVQIGRREP